MKPKMLIIFSLIVIIPTVTIIWLGISLTRSEQSSIKAEFDKVLKQRLHDISGNVAKVIKEKEIELLPLTEIKSVNVENLRQASRSNPHINQVFILNEKRKLIYPSTKAGDLTSYEEAFLERTKDIWESGETFDLGSESPPAPGSESPQIENSENLQTFQNDNPSDDDQVLNASPNQQKLQQSSYGNRSGKNKKSTISNLTSWVISERVEPGEGWYTWFKGQGLHFILWKRNEANMLIGIEINRARLISDIINTLPTEMEARDQTIVLKNASTNLYQWGNHEIEKNEEATVEVSLLPPLQSWKLNCYSNSTTFTNTLGKAMLFNYTVAGCILGVLLAILCIYFYRENSRQLRESATKVNFVNQVSHELKTPLTNIRMYAELLENKLDQTDEKAQKQLGVIVSESQRLSRLINNVLSFAKQEKKKIKLNLREISVDSILDSVVEHFKPSIDKKKIKIKMTKSAPKPLMADADALEQILGNLLSNIEKYVPAEGEVKIETAQDENVTTVTVSDNGPGVPQSQRKQIFNAFYRISNQLSDGVSGTGIGLSISRDLALMHGGDLVLLDSTQGAKFQLKLPGGGKQ